jgi:hypothetical protein
MRRQQRECSWICQQVRIISGRFILSQNVKKSFQKKFPKKVFEFDKTIFGIKSPLLFTPLITQSNLYESYLLQPYLSHVFIIYPELTKLYKNQIGVLKFWQTNFFSRKKCNKIPRKRSIFRIYSRKFTLSINMNSF